MEKFKSITIVFLFVICLLTLAPLYATGVKNFDAGKLEGKAEDLWGDKIELSNYSKGITIIHPFSPANCGYCLVDGEFVRENYFENNEETGGHNFLQCLFNPQLDIYTYAKHYRETSIPVLTFPPTLHRYHRNGFPFLIAFLDGKCIHSGVLYPYEETFRSFRSQFWSGKDVSLIPTSPLKMASYFIEENEQHWGIYVLPDGDDYKKRLSKTVEKWNSTIVKYESELQDVDLQKNLEFRGETERFNFKLFEGKNVPIKISSKSIHIGHYEFPKSDVGLVACFPNPYNKERYIMLMLRGKNSGGLIYKQWVDFTVSRNRTGRRELLIYGFFEKTSNGNWEFSDSLAIGHEGLKDYCKKDLKTCCKNSVCLLPSRPSQEYKIHKHNIYISPWNTTPSGRIRTFGTSACRFPSITIDKNGICWVTWEEKGDILLASVNRPEPQMAMAVENDSSDSFNPKIAFDGSMLWIFYLNSRDNFYRLYGRYFDGNRLSDEILITEKEPFDVVTPAVAANQEGKIIVAWSEWKANYRYLRNRIIVNRSLGKIQEVAIKKPSIDYVNAWYPSLIMDNKGQPWGAWNQHYPAILGVCAGNLVKEATSVTKVTGDWRTEERGGYPSIVIDKRGEKWVFWESFGWDIHDEIPQKILGSYYDEENGQWTIPYTLTLDKQTDLNQTPRAVVDENGVIWVLFSGRKNDIDKPWGIYISRFSENKWSIPKLISRDGVNSRAPDVSIGKDGKIWITWHSGTGEDMKIEVLNYTSTGNIEYLPKPEASKIPAELDIKKRLGHLGAANEKYQGMSPEEVARSFFQACADEDWEEVLKFSDVSQKFKDKYGGLKIISIGKPFKSGNYHGWYVSYKIRLKSGEIQNFNLALCRGPGERFVVDGGI